MACKLIALDLDGTLIRDDLTMSPRVRGALQQAMAQDIRLILASGRSYLSLRPWVEELGITTPVIAYQGAEIVDPLTGRCIYRHAFPHAIVSRVIRFARERDLSLTLFLDDTIYAEKKRHADEFYVKWFGGPVCVVSDLESLPPQDPTKFIIIGTPEELDAVRPQVEGHFGGELQIMRSHRLFLEGLPLGVTKGSALAWLAGELGIARQDTMAIGDSDNDAAMIAWAGCGVAMGNAFASVKAVARYVAPGIEEDGAAEAIERFCLENDHGGWSI